jgi:hypothetical protein
MKTVFSSNSDVIHAFAQRNQSEGKAGNVFFYGDKLYSYGYHYLLAEFIDDNTVVINNRGYSNSTSKHISIASYALSQYKRFYTMSCDLNLVYDQIKDNLKSLSKAKKPWIYIDNINSLWVSLNEFIDYTKQKVKSNPKYRELKKIVNSIQSEDYLEVIKLQRIKTEKAAKIKALKQLEKSLQDFKDYKINSFRINGINDHLRLSQDLQNVETSQSVKVPVNDALLLYKMIKENRDIKGYNISGYTVISINGTLKIGCHNIDIDSMHEVGCKLEKL